jgi:glycosyltransferase involved in cell wall biosynthesis
VDYPLPVSIDATAIPPKMSGVGRYVRNLLAALGRRGDVRVSLITRSGDRERWLGTNPDMDILAVAPEGRAARIAWEQTRLPAVIRDLRPRVHHGPHYTMPRAARVPKVVTVHDMTLIDHPEWHERSKVVFFRNAIRAAMRRAEVILCDSQSTADRLLEWGRVRGEVRVAPLGVDLERFTAAGDETTDGSILDRIGVRRPYIAFIGTVEPRKGVPDLIEAFGRLRLRHPALSLVIAGFPGWGESEAAQAIAASPARDRILRLGYVDDDAVAVLLRRAAVVAYPSLEEGFGLPVLESLACGAPTVTTTGSAMEEFAAGAALLVDPGDVDALAQAVDTLVSGEPTMQARRQLGFAVAAATSWEACADKHVAAYRLAAG